MNYAEARHNMVESQIRTNQVTAAAVLQTLDEVPRELFVPKHLRGVAYQDEDIDLGGGRTLMEPVVFARLLQAARISPTDVVLDIGCANGYSAAVLARLASTVVAVECDPELAARTGALLAQLSVDNVAVIQGSLADGDAAHGPYQVIVIEGAVAQIPEMLLGQLADGGRLIAVVNGEPSFGKATLILRTGDVFSRREVFEAAISPLPGFQAKPRFVF
jgi:protein-L-isoaspartate(D-aspartate) O-methyltransferase